MEAPGGGGGVEGAGLAPHWNRAPEDINAHNKCMNTQTNMDSTDASYMLVSYRS